jgi:hypothetical protein
MFTREDAVNLVPLAFEALEAAEKPHTDNLSQVIMLLRPYFPSENFTWEDLETAVGKAFDDLETGQRITDFWMAMAALASVITDNGGDVDLDVQKAIGRGRWTSAKQQADNEWLERQLEGLG